MLENLIGIKQDTFIASAIGEDLLDNMTSQSSSGQKDVEVSNGSQFSVGEMVILYNGQDDFETALIASINSNTLTMSVNLTNTYPSGSMVGKYIGVIDTGNKKFTRKGAPDLGDGSDGAFVSSGNATWSSEKNYTSVKIQNGHTITVNGNFDIKCQGVFEIESGGKLSAKGKGHAGGTGSKYGYAGSSYNGAGGYQVKNTGDGGGGAGLGSGIEMGCGGGGGYGTAGSNGSYYGNSNNRGIGGITYNTADLSNTAKAYLKGSGGGAGGAASESNNGDGGHGGGIIKISCLSLIVSGEIDCDGNDGTNGNSSPSYASGGGGGGAGGTIFIQALLGVTMGTSLIHANGGSGGLGYRSGSTYPGGNGGNGRIRIEASAVSGTSSPTYASGYAGGASGFTKYGFYFTKKVNLANGCITANCYVRQEVKANEALSSGASSGQADVTVADGDKYEAGDRVVIKEDEKFEIKTIDSVSTNTLTMTENLDNTYTTSAKVFRIDAKAYASLEPVGDDENQQEMTLKDIYFEDSDTYMVIISSKTVKSTNEGDEGFEFVGMVEMKGRANDTVDVNANLIAFEYF